MPSQRVHSANRMVVLLLGGVLGCQAALPRGTAHAQGVAPAPMSQAFSANQPTPSPAATAPVPPAWQRWIDPQAGTIAFRYRYIETSTHAVNSNQVQSQVQVRARLKLDLQARLTVNTFIATGNGITSGWNNTGIGLGDTAWDFPVKHLFVAAVPATGVELSFGSMGPLRGENTEATTLDNDNYLSGERLSVRRPKQVGLDEIAVTSAYLGDASTPNVFRRGQRLFDDRNYFQVFMAKRLNKRLALSGDVTRYAGTPIVHGGVTAGVPWHVIDTLKYEFYVRGGNDEGAGFNVYAEKAVTKRWTLGGGYATIDEHFGTLNADRFFRGNRVHQLSTIRITPEVSAFVFGTAAIATDFRIPNRYRFEVGLTYNVLGGFRRAGWVR